MSRPEYKTREVYLGDGIETEFTFDFKVADPDHLLVYLIDDQGDIVHTVRASDTTYFTTILESQSGKITYLTAPDNDFKLIILLADDAPVQSNSFSGDARYTNLKLENTFDMISGQVQRIRYLLDRSLKLSDTFTEFFNTDIPDPEASAIIAINDTNNGLQLIPIGAISSILARLDQAEADINALEAALAIAEAEIDDHEVRISALEANATDLVALTARVDVLEPIVDDHEVRITALEVPGSDEFNSGTLVLDGLTTIDYTAEFGTTKRALISITSTGGAILNAAAPQIDFGGAIPPGTILYLVGGSNVNTVEFVPDANLDINGNCILTTNQMLALIYLDNVWREMFRRS